VSARVSYFGLIIALVLGCGAPEIEIECVAPPAPTPVKTESTENTEAALQENTHGTSRRMRRTADRTRNAAVEVHNHMLGRNGTGTYFEFKDHFIVLTAAHVVNGADILEVRTPLGESIPALVILFDNIIPNDLAVLILKDPLSTRTPMDLQLRENIDSLVGDEVVYTGNPGRHNQMTIFGNISGFESDGSIIMHSYAWGGASGSGVFDERGRLVGILRATDVNRSRFSPYPQITEDIVWLSPAHSIDLTSLGLLLSIYDMMLELEQGGGR
tara:strand:- start:140 stop:952 length:813 start_codon:yes stop_codon:yes gene_type:complete